MRLSYIAETFTHVKVPFTTGKHYCIAVKVDIDKLTLKWILLVSANIMLSEAGEKKKRPWVVLDDKLSLFCIRCFPRLLLSFD